jgi:hypothetical protein
MRASRRLRGRPQYRERGGGAKDGRGWRLPAGGGGGYDRGVSEQAHILLDVAGKLDALGIPFMLSGSLALSVYAEPRMTRDIDLVVELTPDGVEPLVEALSSGYYVDRDAVRKAVRARDMFNAIHRTSVVKVDFIVRKEDDYRRTEFGRRRFLEWSGRTLPVVAPEDLLLSKLVWAAPSHSELQLRDARTLVAGVPALDRDYLRTWASRLGVLALLEEIGT